jgi:hypothetical protein
MHLSFKTILIKKIKVASLWPLVLTAIVSILFYKSVFAAHPMITDDTGTQGKGKIQIEFNDEYGIEKEDGVTEKTTELAGTFTYGFIDNLDLIAGIPYLFLSNEVNGETTKEKGISDVSFEAKWRFYEIDKFSFALKSGISFPSGDEKKGIGSGKVGYYGLFINTINLEPFIFHINLGYFRNENKLNEEENIWHLSGACEYLIIKNLKFVTDIGIKKNTDPDAIDNPVYILGGIIYSAKYNIDLDAGIKYGLNKPETDYSFLAGITIKI